MPTPMPTGSQSQSVAVGPIGRRVFRRRSQAAQSGSVRFLEMRLVGKPATRVRIPLAPDSLYRIRDLALRCYVKRGPIARPSDTETQWSPNSSRVVTEPTAALMPRDPGPVETPRLSSARGRRPWRGPPRLPSRCLYVSVCFHRWAMRALGPRHFYLCRASPAPSRVRATAALATTPAAIGGKGHTALTLISHRT